MVFENYIFNTLYLNITNKCLANCSYCKLGNSNNTTVASLDDMVRAVELVKPSAVVITGGEPLLYKRLIKDFLNFYEIDYRRHWDVTICTSFIGDIEIDKELTSLVDTIQYTYSEKRIKKIGKEKFESIINSLDRMKLDLTTIYTVLPEDMKRLDSEDKIKEYFEYILPFTDGISFEALSYDESFEDYQKYLDDVDKFMSIAFKYVPLDKNLNISQWNRFRNSSFGITCSSCDIGCAHTMLPTGNVIKTCNCGIDRIIKHFENRKNKVLNKCGECAMFYYEHCKAGCERFEEYCAFPKITYSNWYRGDYNA
jgi:organic radical activating enzyme